MKKQETKTATKNTNTRISVDKKLIETLQKIKDTKGFNSQSEAVEYLINLWESERNKAKSVSESNKFDPTISAESKLHLFFDALVDWNKEGKGAPVHFGKQSDIAAITGMNPSVTIKPYLEANKPGARFAGVVEPVTKEARAANFELMKQAVIVAKLGDLFPKAKA